MRSLLPIITALVLAACSDGSETAQERPPAPTVPEYTITRDIPSVGSLRSVRVEIAEPHPEKDLRLIVNDVVRRDPSDYPNTRVFFYLPGQGEHEAAWAVSEFNPDLKVTINGLPGPQPTTGPEEVGEVLGRWEDPQPMFGSRITIRRVEGRWMLHQRFADGSLLNKQLVEKPWDEGRRFQWADGLAADDFFVLRPDGNLAIYLQSNLDAVARRIED